MSVNRLTILLITFCLASCVKKPKEEPVPVLSPQNHGLLILNEGTWNHNNASLTFYHSNGNVSQNVYEAVNEEKLGDVANDIKKYGSKLYIVVNESSNLVVLDASTFKLIKRIPLFNEGTPRSPRNITFHLNKAYVTAFDGYVLQLDTTLLTIEKTVKVGRNPDGLAVQHGKLYVTNSGGLDYPNYDTTVSVIDLNTFQELKKITVGLNPGGIAVDGEGDVYVVARGNHTDVLPKLVRINSSNDEVEEVLSNKVFSIKIKEDRAYVSYNNAAFNAPEIRIFDPLTETISETQFTNLADLSGFYGFDILKKGVVCYDAKNFSVKGDAFWFDNNGTLITKISCGFIPSAVIEKEN